MPVADSSDPTVVTEPVDPGFFPEADPSEESEWARLEEEAAMVAQLNGQASSETPPHPATPGIPADSGAGRKDPVADLEFDPKHRDDFDGLMYLGALTHTFPLYGHSFTIHTLTVDEMLEASLAIKEWDGTLGRDRAYLTAMVAACCDRVDGKPVHSPLGPNDNVTEGKFRYVRANWFPWVIDGVYAELMKLEARVTEILSLMGEGSG